MGQVLHSKARLPLVLRRHGPSARLALMAILTRSPSRTQPSQPVTLILMAPTSTPSGTRLAPVLLCTVRTQFKPSADLLCTCKGTRVAQACTCSADE